MIEEQDRTSNTIYVIRMRSQGDWPSVLEMIFVHETKKTFVVIDKNYHRSVFRKSLNGQEFFTDYSAALAEWLTFVEIERKIHADQLANINALCDLLREKTPFLEMAKTKFAKMR